MLTRRKRWAPGQGVLVSLKEVRHLRAADAWPDHGRSGCRAGRGGPFHDHAVAAGRQAGRCGGAGRLTARSLG